MVHNPGFWNSNALLVSVIVSRGYARRALKRQQKNTLGWPSPRLKSFQTEAQSVLGIKTEDTLASNLACTLLCKFKGFIFLFVVLLYFLQSNKQPKSLFNKQATTALHCITNAKAIAYPEIIFFNQSFLYISR
jgi:hypothetical protein